ncbi:MAG: RHS repeat-associated core domain-containing protein, partial [Oscillochloris sp.]|nr:RHS repeat-associated core domain-containing protein [Oscillochloris sp.]
YDAAGNLLSDGTTTYTYDALGRTLTQGGTSYSSNGDGVLVAAGTIAYTQDLAAPLSQILSDGSTNYLYGRERLASSAGTWYLTDALGSVRQTLDASGAVTASANYDPWGVPQTSSIAPFGFTGELQDSAGQVYLRARWYNAGSGTFTSRDSFLGSVIDPQSLHLYVYVHNNPANFIDPSGWYRCVTGAKDYQAFCQEQWKKMDEYLDVQNPESWIKTDSLRALLFMFSDKLQSSNTPGGSGAKAQKYRQKDMPGAAERLEFVLWYTESSPGAATHFREDDEEHGIYGLEWNDSGFAKEFQDGKLWPDSNRQVGHFLTAVHLGYQGYLPSPALDIACIIGHEISGDALFGEGGGNAAYQCAEGLLNDGTRHIQGFLDAVLADIEGNTELRDCLLYDIVGLPDEFDSTNPIIRKLRSGNSMQDMRLSLKGWIFGQKIKGGSIKTLEQSRLWLIDNLRPH